MTGLNIPAVTTDYIGPLVRLTFRCRRDEWRPGRHSHNLYLRAFNQTLSPAGAVFIDGDSKTVPVTIVGRENLAGLGATDIAAATEIRCESPD